MPDDVRKEKHRGTEDTDYSAVASSVNSVPPCFNPFHCENKHAVLGLTFPKYRKRVLNDVRKEKHRGTEDTEYSAIASSVISVPLCFNPFHCENKHAVLGLTFLEYRKRLPDDVRKEKHRGTEDTEYSAFTSSMISVPPCFNSVIKDYLTTEFGGKYE